jgi:quercetin dioxygenase-like cupin family protein
MISSVAELPAVTGTCPEPLTAAVRRAVHSGGSWQQTAERVAAALRPHLPGPGLPSLGLLSPEQLAGDPAGYQVHLVHAEPDGSFSIMVMVWLPGQETPVHDHLSWCCTAVLQGTEYEEVYAVRGDHLEVIASNANPAGTVSGFAPPGDVHLVRNIGDTVAVSMHVYGTDIARVGSSVRRVYDLLIR